MSLYLREKEAQRLVALRSFGVLDSPSEPPLDNLILLASRICDVPIALIGLVDETRQWFKSGMGLDVQEIPREHAFGAHAILVDTTFIVEDTLTDPRFKENPLVLSGPRVRFYAGAQLRTAGGHNIGTLSIFDRVPRHLNDHQLDSLQILARQIVLAFEHLKERLEQTRRSKFVETVLAMIPDTVSYIDHEYTYRYANQSYEKWFKIDPNSLVGQPMSTVFSESVLNAAKPFIDRALRGELQEYHPVQPLELGAYAGKRFTESVYVPDIKPDGSIGGILSVTRDVTRVKMAEARALSQSKELEAALERSQTSARDFRAIFNNSPIGIIHTDSQLRFVSANSAYSEFIGYSEDELKTMSVYDITHPDDIEATRLAASKLDSKTQLKRFVKRYLHRSGKTVWVAVTTQAMASVDGTSANFFFSAIEDVTESRARELDLKAAQTKLVGSAKMAALGEMAGGVAHEVNNPLAVISGKSRLMIDAISNGQADMQRLRTDLLVIEKTARRIAAIVRGLRSFSRDCEADPFELSSVRTIVDDTVNLCQERFRKAGIALSVSCPNGPQIECRPAQISQIIMNLLSNAYDAASLIDLPWVSINVVVASATVDIQVRDIGSGIPPLVADRIMEPFFTTKEVGKGTGLGLSISKGIAESHNGLLRYEPTDPHTCFVLSLPWIQQGRGLRGNV